MTDQNTTTETPSRDRARQQRQKQKSLRRRRMIGIPALVLAASVFGYGVWMMLDDDLEPQVGGETQENTTTTSPDAFPEDDQLPGVDVGDPAFDESGGVEDDTGLIDATSIVREDP